MKSLIINADDLGADEPRNHGIFEAIEAGRVTSVSILVNGNGFEGAMERWKSLGNTGISLGIHINLSEGRPIRKDLNLLTDKDGYFLGKQTAQELLKRKADGKLEREIQEEIKAQIDVLKEYEVPIKHLDGHQHIHIMPAVLPIAVSEASSSKIRWIRIPDEPQPSIRNAMSKADILDEAAISSSLGAAARSFVMLSEIESCDHFRGLYLKGKLDIIHLEELFQNLPIGLTEFMVHPGRAADSETTGPFTTFSSTEREKELAALLDPVFPILLQKYGIDLTPFPEGFP